MSRRGQRGQTHRRLDAGEARRGGARQKPTTGALLARREAELAAQHQARQLTPVRPTVSIEPGVTSSSLGVPCLIPALRNVRLPKDFKGPRNVTPQNFGLVLME